MDMKNILAKISELKGCTVFPSLGIPIIDRKHELPGDLSKFYELCGGLELYKNSKYPLRIVSPVEVVRANPIIIGEMPEIPNNGIPVGDISEDWYIIGDDFNGDYITIDLCIKRLGRCYDSFHELYPGNSQIIAWSFTELLERLIENRGNHWYWLQKNFDSLGLAYDDI